MPLPTFIKWLVSIYVVLLSPPPLLQCCDDQLFPFPNPPLPSMAKLVSTQRRQAIVDCAACILPLVAQRHSKSCNICKKKKKKEIISVGYHKQCNMAPSVVGPLHLQSFRAKYMVRIYICMHVLLLPSSSIHVSIAAPVVDRRAAAASGPPLSVVPSSAVFAGRASSIVTRPVVVPAPTSCLFPPVAWDVGINVRPTVWCTAAWRSIPIAMIGFFPIGRPVLGRP